MGDQVMDELAPAQAMGRALDDSAYLKTQYRLGLLESAQNVCTETQKQAQAVHLDATAQEHRPELGWLGVTLQLKVVIAPVM